jgi:predicted flap endonuclease-1-like 5' DNA nuclease
MAHETGAPTLQRDEIPDSSMDSPTDRDVPLVAARPSLAERIVVLPPRPSADAFRTKVKVKATIFPNGISSDGTGQKSTEAAASGGAAANGTRRDDLTRIRGIDAALAARMATFGVTRFAQIAAWEQGDVQTISQTLDLGRMISRQNWIEQAALLVPLRAADAVADTTVTAKANAVPLATGDPVAVSPVLAGMSPVAVVPGPKPERRPIAVATELAVRVPVNVPVPVLTPLAVAHLPPVVPVPVVAQVGTLAALVPDVSTYLAPVVPVPDVLPGVVAVLSLATVLHPEPPRVPVPLVVLPADDFVVDLAALPGVRAGQAQVPPVVPVPEVRAAAVQPFVPNVPVVLLNAPPTVGPADVLVLPRFIPVDQPGDAKFHQAVVHIQAVSAAAASAVAAPIVQTATPVPPLPEIELRPEVEVAPPLATALSPPLPTPPLPIDAELETQLHAAVAGAADDRAVAATLDLLAAFAPPPAADEPAAGTIAPTFEAVTFPQPAFAERRISASRAQLAEAEADNAFTRWVLTAPNSQPPVVPERWAPATPSLDLAAGSAPNSDAAFDPALRARPRDRWSTGAVQAPAAAPPELIHEPEPEPVAPAVAPTMLDRLASLEAELTALAANDQPRGRPAEANDLAGQAPPRTLGAQPTAARGVSSAADPIFAQVRPGMTPPPPVPQYRNAAALPFKERRAIHPLSPAGRRLPPPLTPSAPSVGFTNSGGGEADVVIVPREADAVDIRAIAQGPSLGTLEQRLRRARPTPEVDVETYAGYHANIGEASVEIVRRDAHTRAVVFSDNGERHDERAQPGRQGSIARFFKALKGEGH